MATVNKNFRIKNGLVVEGSTATVNGQNILTETGSDTYILNLIGGETLVKSVSGDFTVSAGGELQIKNSSDLARTGDITTAINDLDTDDIEEGASNQYFTSQRALDATSSAYDAAGTADTAISNALGGGGSISDAISTAINGLDTDDIEEGSTNLYYTDSRVTNVITSDLAIVTGNIPTAIDNAINALDTDDIEEGATNLYFTNQRALDATNTAYDAYGAASTAEGNANTYTDNAINALDTDDIEEGATNRYFTDGRAKDAVGLALASGGGLSYSGVDSTFSVDTSIIATKTYVDDAIDNLVDGAPGLLDTLNEIAAAINDDENYFTTVTNAIAAKQDTLTAGSNIDITSNTISVTGLDTDDVAEGENLYFTDERAIDAVSNADIYPNAVIIDNVAKQVAATTGNIATAAATTALAWAKADYRSGKFTVKVKNGSHTEISEILVTLDTSDNVAITEYGIVGTNGTLATVSADVSGSDVRIRVTPANDNSEVMVVGTLLI